MSKQEDSKEQESELSSPEVQQELSQVATNPKRNLLVIVGVCAVLGYFAINLFFTSNAPQVESKPPAPIQVVKPATNDVTDVPSIPQLPEPPKIEEPQSPPPPPPPVEEKLSEVPLPPPPSLANDNLPPPPTIAQALPSDIPARGTEGEEARRRKEAKRRSSIVLVAGNPDKKTPEQLEQEADFKLRGDTNFVLGRGKIIDAVLESAVNTDFGGEIRAVISRDIYSESGRVILIPKGTRAFGVYTTGVSETTGYIAVEWVRVDLPTGYTLNFQGTGVDNLGKKGYAGRVDTKFKEKFANVLMTSVFNVAAANVVDSIVPPVNNTQVNSQNSASATSIRNLALAISGDPNKNASTKVAEICSGVRNAITDKSSEAYLNFDKACLSLSTSLGATAEQQLSSLMSSVNTAADGLIRLAVNSATASKAQDAAKQGFTDITKTVTDQFKEAQFKTTITIAQGTPVKIYVNKDYKFPKAAVSKTRVMQ